MVVEPSVELFGSPTRICPENQRHHETWRNLVEPGGTLVEPCQGLGGTLAEPSAEPVNSLRRPAPEG